MVTIVEFINARLNEREQAARAALKRHEPDEWTPPLEDPWPEDEAHVVLHGPRSVLSDVEAKRKLIGLHQPQYASDDPDTHYGSHYEVLGDREVLVRDNEKGPPNWCRTCQDNAPCMTVRLLARPYDKHPDFDPAWRP